jgi:hypothetical protein
MPVNRFPRHRLLLALPLALAAMGLIPVQKLFAQTAVKAGPTVAGTTMVPSAPARAALTGAVANNAPDSRAVEAQRRLNLSHRRRQEQIEENAQTNLLLTASQVVTAPETAHRRHRVRSMHRNTTAQGRSAAMPPPVPATDATAVGSWSH